MQQKKVHDANMKAAALQREAEMLRSMVDKQKSQIHQLQDLLANREQQHRLVFVNYHLCVPPANKSMSVCLSVDIPCKHKLFIGFH